MKRLLLSLLVLSLTASCATRRVSDETVDSWAQRAEERGKLAVGRVASVERIAFVVDRPSTSSAAAMGAAPPAVGVLGVAILDRIRDSGYFFRHTVLMADGTERKFDLDASYKVGECVAFRSGLQAENQFPVRALPGECTGA